MSTALAALKSERLKGDESQGYYRDLAMARTEHETYRALLMEMEYRRKSGELVHRDEVERVVSRAFSALVQDLRALPDMVERRHGIKDGKLLAIIDQSVDQVLRTAHDSLAGLFT